MSVHTHANAFDNSAQEYEQGRPGYPYSLLDWINSRGHLTPKSTVVDLGAGTGKLTRLLVESSAKVIAIEPIAAMREQFSLILPEVELLDANAEEIPLPDKSVDIVACGQSIRWFATDAALTEIARVLRSDGELIITFNRSDESSPLQRRLEQMIREVNAVSEERKPGASWREVVLANPHFELLDEVVLPNKHMVERSRLANRLHSSSQFSRLPPERQNELIAELEGMAETDFVELDQLTSGLALRKVDIR
jgi:ubiquinone/menaquinone biosynthesis C-methylase UbiE